MKFRADPSSLRGSIAPVVTPFTEDGELDAARADGEPGARAKVRIQTDDVDRLEPGESERLTRGAARQLQRQHAHAHKVRTVDPLERLGDHCLHAEEPRALGRPVA